MAKEAYSYTSIPEEQIDHALPSQERRRVQCRLTGKTKKTKKTKFSQLSALVHLLYTEPAERTIENVCPDTHSENYSL